MYMCLPVCRCDASFESDLFSQREPNINPLYCGLPLDIKPLFTATRHWSEGEADVGAIGAKVLKLPADPNPPLFKLGPPREVGEGRAARAARTQGEAREPETRVSSLGVCCRYHEPETQEESESAPGLWE